MTTSLDLGRLEKVRRVGNKILARCPACAENGGDRRGNHLAILESGNYGCAAFPGDTDHRRRINALVGMAKDHKSDPEQRFRWLEQRAAERWKAHKKSRLIDAAKLKRSAIINRHQWDPADVWEDSPQRIDCPMVESDPRHFLSSLFQPDTLLWAGETNESGSRHARRWRTCRDWASSPTGERVGPMTSPAIWKPETISRAASNVLASPFVVLDFDGFDGAKPVTPEELQIHTEASLALIHWLRVGLNWQLAAILWTGGKSLHAWFHSPAREVMESLKANAEPLGLDAGLIGRPEHPCRLPGHVHAKTGNRSRVLWLQFPPT